jgi:1,2-diacylglycerol 3-beta-glucosyltransferase
VPELLALAMKRRDPVLADLALELMVPPLSYLVAAGVAGTTWWGLALMYGVGGWPAGLLWTVSDACLLLYVVRGWALSGVGMRGLLDLAWAPVYVLWKASLLFGRAQTDAEWVRTSREARS